MEFIETDERGPGNPWERARAWVFAAFLGEGLHEGVKVLGVGGGHLCRTLFGGLADKEVEAVEQGLCEEGLRRLKPEPGITYITELPPARNRYDLTLTVLSSGYLFGSQLVPRFLGDCLLSWGRVRKQATWQGRALLGAILAGFLQLASS